MNRSQSVTAAIESSVEESRIRWKLDDRLAGIHALFERLSRFEYGGKLHSLEVIRMMRDGSMVGGFSVGNLPADQAALLDCMSEADDFAVAFVKVLYWTQGGVAWKARRLNLTKTRFYEERSRVLFEFRGAMRSYGFSL